MIKLYLSNSPFQFSEEAYIFLGEFLAELEKTFIEYDADPTQKMIGLERNLVFHLQNLLAYQEDKVVTKSILEKAIDLIDSQYTTVEERNDSQTREEHQKKAYDNKGISRDETRGLIGGVCAGLANFFNLSIVLVRGSFLLLTVIYFFPVVLYLFLWLILPKETSPTQQIFNATYAKDLKNKVFNFFIFNKAILVKLMALVLLIPLVILAVSLAIGIGLWIFSGNLSMAVHTDGPVPYFLEILFHLSKWDMAVVWILILLVLLYLIRTALILFKEQRLVWQKKWGLMLGVLLILGTLKVALFRNEEGMKHQPSQSFSQESKTIVLDASYKAIVLTLESNTNRRRTIPFEQAGDYIYVKMKRKRNLENIKVRLKVLSVGDDMRLNYPLRILNNQIFLPNFLIGKRRGNWAEKKVELEIYLPDDTKVQIGDALRSNSRFIFIRE